ncbi:MAG: Ig-like domain-containing protein [Calditrichaceae bacterium]
MFKKYFILLSMIILWQCSLPEIEDVTPPEVVVAYPYDGAVVSAPVDVRISASDDEEVTEVWYYLDGMASSSVTDAPYEIQLNPAGLERKVEHHLQAAAKDKEGNIGYSDYIIFTVAETQDIIDPTVTIVNPQTGQVVEGMVDIVADAEDERSIQKVAFYINGDSVGLSSAYPYIYQWNTSNYSDSTEHSIYVKAWDGGNNTATSEVITVTVYPRTGPAGDDINPTALFLYPSDGSTVAGTVRIALDIADNDSLAKIELYVDGELETSEVNPSSPWIYNWDTADKADSLSHNLYVKVYDGAGNIGTTQRNVTIFSDIGSSDPDVIDPVALILYPLAGTTISGTIPVSVDLFDNIRVTRVEFYVDGQLVNSTNNPSIPWTFNWDSTPQAGGELHSIYIKAYDSAGNIGTSALLTLTVN